MDLISRQAAIDAIQTINSDGDSIINSVLGIIELKIFDLPSVQPDIARDIATIIENEQDMRVISAVQPEIVRCRNCKWKQGSECVRFAEVRPFPDDFCSRAERRTDE